MSAGLHRFRHPRTVDEDASGIYLARAIHGLVEAPSPSLFDLEPLEDVRLYSVPGVERRGILARISEPRRKRDGALHALVGSVRMSAVLVVKRVC